MAATIAGWVLGLVAVYLAAGFLFAILFVRSGVGRIDPAAREATLGFRIFILPGVMALWPILARRWMAGKTQPPVECNAHRSAARPSHD